MNMTMNMTMTRPRTMPLTEKCGLSVESSQARLAELDPAEVRGWLATYGAVLFRSFATDVSAVVQFTEQFLARALIHGEPSRRARTDDGTLDEVSPGRGDIALHAELALTPRRPDLIWFYCKKPADSGGETVICDGIRVFQALAPRTRALFVRNPIRYVTRILPGTLQRHFPELTHEEAVRRLARLPRAGTTIRMTRDGGVMEYVTSAVVRTRWGGQPAFANSITGPYEDSRKWMGFDELGPIPEAVMAELREVTEQESVLVKLQAGELIMIDNSRLMHGRRGFRGERAVLVRMGMANW